MKISQKLRHVYFTKIKKMKNNGKNEIHLYKITASQIYCFVAKDFEYYSNLHSI